MKDLLFVILLGVWGGLAIVQASPPSSPADRRVSVIYDTDMNTDIDDMLALAMLHTLQHRAEIELLAVTVCTPSEAIPRYIDLVNTFYGHGDIPVGIIARDETGSGCAPGTPQSSYSEYISTLRRAGGSFVFPHDLVGSKQVDDAVSLLRRTLAAQPDASVVMIQVGSSTNFARLLDSEPDKIAAIDGLELVRRKVLWLSTMAGKFGDPGPDGEPFTAQQAETNIVMDIPAAQRLFSRWPTPIVASGFEIGVRMRLREQVIDRCFAYAPRHPVPETYKYSADNWAVKRPHNHWTWDLTSVLYAARPNEGYFDLSDPGTITVLDNGETRFVGGKDGQHRYLVLTEAQKARALEAMEMLVSQPPVNVPNP